jgi:sugar phosphate isomerase/epimerase
MQRETKNRRGDMFESCTLGKGSIDFQKILSYGAKKGLHTFIVEQEAYTGSTPMEAAEDNAEYMTNLKV